jgi:hypothetical protein
VGVAVSFLRLDSDVMRDFIIIVGLDSDVMRDFIIIVGLDSITRRLYLP